MTTTTRHGAPLAAALTLALTAVGCSEPLDVDEVAWSCEQNSDCGPGGWVCAFHPTFGAKVCQDPGDLAAIPDAEGDAPDGGDVADTPQDVGPNDVVEAVDTEPDAEVDVPPAVCGAFGIVCPDGVACMPEGYCDGGEGRALVPEASLWMGCEGQAACAADEVPVHEVGPVPAFAIGRTEVTVAEYLDCVTSGTCGPPQTGTGCHWGQAGKDDHPMNCVSQAEAADYCAHAGGRLCSEAEWELAARGGCALREGDCRTAMAPIQYPWGDFPAACSLANYATCGGVAVEVGTLPGGVSAYGVHDAAGNVREWVSDCYHASYDAAPGDGAAWTTDCGGVGGVLRGGHFDSPVEDIRATARAAGGADAAGTEVDGIRCCWDVE